MSENEMNLRNLLDSAALDAVPDTVQMDAVREKLKTGAVRPLSRMSRRRVAGATVVGLLIIGGAAIASTPAGRAWIVDIFTPVTDVHTVSWESPDGSLYTRTMGDAPPSSIEADAVQDSFREIDAIVAAGGGRLVGMIESPNYVNGEPLTVYMVEYTLSDGNTIRVGCNPVGLQAEALHLEEIRELRDAGAGELLAEYPCEIGLGRFMIRFALEDGSTVELEMFYPPGTRQERERIFSELRRLKADRHFTVSYAERCAEHPELGVRGLLRYTLADGRMVGISEQVPNELVSPDGKGVLQPETNEYIAIQPDMP